MTTYYICRHGETENNKEKRLSGWIDTPLTEAGVKNAINVAAKLKNITIDKIISSDLGRTFVTAYIISRQIGYESSIDRYKELREVNYGDLANLPINDAIAAYPAGLNISTNVAPNGESLAQMQQRVVNFIEVLSIANSGKTILIVGHDGTINAVYANYTNQDIGEVDSSRSNNHDLVAKFTVANNKVESFAEQ
jgi:alpha-ribazole phosphatase